MSQHGQLNTVKKDPSKGKDEHLYKVIVIGDYAVGKTSLIKRYCEGYFTPNYKLTIGVDFAVKSLDWDDNTKITLQLWDVAGHERFGTMTRVYYKYAIAGIIVFDLSRPATFEAVSKWQEDVNNKVVLANEEPIPLLLLANKCDIADPKIDKETLDEYARSHGFIGWYYTSAQDNTNIDDAMNFLVRKILDVAQSNKPRAPEETVVLSNESQDNPVDVYERQEKAT
jgi:Ras-related protein Rab-32